MQVGTDLAFDLDDCRGGGAREQALFDAIAAPAMLMDEDGLIVGTNAKAERLLRSGRRIWHKAGHLHTGSPEQDRAIIQAARRAAKASSQTAMALQLPDYSTGLVVFTPLPQNSMTALLGDCQACTLAQLTLTEGMLQIDVKLLMSTYALTPAEARIVQLMVSGYSGPGAARLLGTSLHTVRTQIARAYEKIGVRSQAALMRLLAPLAS